MPYCPKCDMEFVEGITVCSDCHGPLVESKEAADAMKRQAEEEALARQQTEYEAMQAAYEEEMAALEYQESDLENRHDMSPASAYGAVNDLSAAEPRSGRKSAPVRTRVYVKKSEQYSDLKSSADAFLLVGGLLTIAAILIWTNFISIPMAGLSGLIIKLVLTAMGVGSLAIAYKSFQSAKKVSSQVAEEEQVTRQLVDWFISSYTGDGLDQQIAAESGELSPEELSLKRFGLIQDIIITTHDITDQSYVDLLCEEIYGKLFED